MVLLYFSPSNMHVIKVNGKETFFTAGGMFPHQKMIGLAYGSRVKSHNGQIACHLLHLSPEWWTLSLPHRTQIIYTPDISLITGQLDLRPGSIVVESGTGSASFTHALARTVAGVRLEDGRAGKVYTFEYHSQRAEAAKKEFEEHGLEDVVLITHRDVCKDGFVPHCTRPENNDVELVPVPLEHQVDAVFLDLPEPWKAIPHTVNLFNNQNQAGGRICCFSPCIEQVQKTIECLANHQFTEITMVECLQRNLEANRREDDDKMIDVRTLISEGPKLGIKRPQAVVDSEVKSNACAETEERPNIPESTDTQVNPLAAKFQPQPDFGFMTRCPFNEVKGHTAFLTFATYLPATSLDNQSRTDEDLAPDC